MGFPQRVHSIKCTTAGKDLPWIFFDKSAAKSAQIDLTLQTTADLTFLSVPFGLMLEPYYTKKYRLNTDEENACVEDALLITQTFFLS